MNHRTTPRLARLAVVATTLSLSAVLAGCASDADGGDDDFASSSTGGGTDSVVLAEQPWVDLQVENEIAVQVLDELGYDASEIARLRVSGALG